MLKSELLNKLSAIEDTADVDAEILNLGFAKPIDSIDTFKDMLANNQLIKGFYASEKDRAVTNGIKTYEEKTLPTKLEEALKAKSNEGKTPEQIQMQEMQKEIDNMKTEKVKTEMSSKYTKTLSEKGLDAGLVDFVLGNDDESTNANIEKINALIASAVDAQVKSKLNQGGNQVPPNQTGAVGGKVTWEQVTENPELMSQYQAQEK